jgi:hypothetical protein
MNDKEKSTKGAPQEGPGEIRVPKSALTDFAMLMHRNVTRLAGLQKTILETLGEQTADMAEAIGNATKSGYFGNTVPVLDITARAVQCWAGAQKELLDLTVGQSEDAMKTFAKRSNSASQCMEEIADFAQHTAGRAMAAQKRMLDFAAEHNKTIAEAFRRQPGVKGSPLSQVTDSLERGFDSFIGMHKDFLDNAEKLGRSTTVGRP